MPLLVHAQLLLRLPPHTSRLTDTSTPTTKHCRSQAIPRTRNSYLIVLAQAIDSHIMHSSAFVSEEDEVCLPRSAFYPCSYPSPCREAPAGHLAFCSLRLCSRPRSFQARCLHAFARHRHFATLILRAFRDCYNQALSNLFNPKVTTPTQQFFGSTN